jgi:hypothetical protein
MYDARLGRPGPVIEKLQVLGGRQAVSDAQRARIEGSYQAYVNWLGDAWASPGVLAPVAVGDARADYIKRTTSAWRQPTVRADLRRDQVPRPPPYNTLYNDPELGPRHADYTVDPDDPDDVDPYVRSLRSSVEEIDPDSDDAADQIEAAQRRMSVYQPGATASSALLENARYRPRDSAQGVRDAAYSAYCQRISEAWRT